MYLKMQTQHLPILSFTEDLQPVWIETGVAVPIVLVMAVAIGAVTVKYCMNRFVNQ